MPPVAHTTLGLILHTMLGEQTDTPRSLDAVTNLTAGIAPGIFTPEVICLYLTRQSDRYILQVRAQPRRGPRRPPASPGTALTDL